MDRCCLSNRSPRLRPISLRLLGMAVLSLGALADCGLCQNPPTPGQAPRLASPSPLRSGRAQPQLTGTSALRPTIVRAEAFAGKPYGVGKVTFRLHPEDQLIDRTEAILVQDPENRILYPMVTGSAFETFLENVTGARDALGTGMHVAWFLFDGDQPLQISVVASDVATREVEVEFVRDRQFDRRVKQWWQAFNQRVDNQIEAGDYPPMVQAYLKALVGKRFGLVAPPEPRRNPDPLFQTFELMFDMESLRVQTIESLMLEPPQPVIADRMVPEAIAWSPTRVENLPRDIAVEPIVRCVPEECFYLRFGTWGNQIWLQRLMEEFGGDLSRMLQVRGFKYRIQSKFLDQLAIRSTEFDKLFGGNLISDVAVIGTDTYVDHGSAVGVLLQAKATDQLRANLKNKRKQFAADSQNGNVTLQEIQFGEDTIEFLSTPDNRYRSFYVVSGDSHLVTTSLVLAKRFLEAGRGLGSLADTDEFRFARYQLPLEREDTVFVYVSTRFLQNLLTPQYQIELRRRNRIATKMMVLELAKLAAFNESYPDDSIEGLVRAGYLPVGFADRPDGGSFETHGDHWDDSIRGRRGFFAPIPDLPLAAVTSEEVAWFNQRAQFFIESIRTLDPMVMALKRYQLEDNVERIVFDARLAPIGEEKYGWLLSMLGEPTRQHVAPQPDDIISFQASMIGGNGGRKPAPPHLLFAGVQDHLHEDVDRVPSSFVRTLKVLREVPGYVGTVPGPGYLDFLPALGGQPDPEGFTYSRFLKLWRLQWGEFSLISFDRRRLEELKNNLHIVEAERPAQVRLQVGDLSQSQLRSWANSVNYQRSWQTSIANVQLLNLLTQQFRLPAELALATAERMLDVELVCSLNGEYELATLPTGRQVWQSTAWPSFNRPELPEDHVAPLLTWFRGLEMEATKQDTQFLAHGFLDIERAPGGGALPSFDLFQGFGGLLGGNRPAPPQRSGGEAQGTAK